MGVDRICSERPGGVALGASLTPRRLDTPLGARLGDGEASFNPWIKTSGDGITRIAPQSDVGIAHRASGVSGLCARPAAWYGGVECGCALDRNPRSVAVAFACPSDCRDAGERDFCGNRDPLARDTAWAHLVFV